MCGCRFISGEAHLVGTDGKVDESGSAALQRGLKEKQAIKDEHARQNRIEALRAASRIAEAKIAAGDGFLTIDGKNTREQTWMLTLADIIARWLETGER